VNIGLVLPGFSADPTDWCIPALRHLARALALPADDDVRVVTLRYPYQASRYTIDGVETIALGGALSHGRDTSTLWRNALRLLHREHGRRPFDILHAFWATESGLLAAMAGRLLHVPTLVSLAGGELVAFRDIDYGDQRLAWERLKVAASLRLATGVSAGSRQLASMALPHVGNHRRGRRRGAGRPMPSPSPNPRLHLAPLGVDLDLFSPTQPCAANQPTLSRGCGSKLLHVAALTPVKDQAVLLRAFAKLHRCRQFATLEIVGDGPLRRHLEHLAFDLGLQESVRFLGDLNHADLPAVYRSADGFVMSSRHEAQCMVALEAAACGAPVVGTRVGVIPELTAAASAVGDADALAREISAVLDSHARSDRDPTLAYIRGSFGLEACTSRFRQLYAALSAP
jgi:glycosyltransferase involved in cell wall biosynthesis